MNLEKINEYGEETIIVTDSLINMRWKIEIDESHDLLGSLKSCVLGSHER